jgi:hypothetical protein
MICFEEALSHMISKILNVLPNQTELPNTISFSTTRDDFCLHFFVFRCDH